MTITTGLTALDDLIGGGLQPGSLTVYAGVSQSGMTTMLDTTVSAAALKDRVPTLLADLESTDRENRIMAAYSGVKLINLQRGTLANEGADTIAQVEQATADASLHYTKSLSLPHLLADAMDTDAKLIAIDGARYVQPGPGGDSDLGAILVGLAGLARSRGAAVVITAPINRNEVRPGDAPSMNSLDREYALHCDVAVLLRRWGSFVKNDPKPETVELFVEKNRFGACGTVVAQGDYVRARFLDAERPHAAAA